MPSVRVDLSEQGIDKIIQKLDDLKKALNDLSQPVEELCIMGRATADAVLSNAHATFPGPRDSVVDYVTVDNKGAVGMSGRGAPFIEFGAGVYYNPSEPYPLPRPPGIVGIGEYGMGQGKNETWSYGGRKTHGNPASKPLYWASQIMETHAPGVFKKVIDNALR